MTNFEKYKSGILDFLDDFAVDKCSGRADSCLSVENCDDCKFYHKEIPCRNVRMQWLYEEYVEPPVDWNSVPIDTKVLVSDNGTTWENRHFAGVDSDDGKPTVYIHGMTSWSAGDTTNWVKYIFTKLVEEKNYD